MATVTTLEEAQQVGISATCEMERVVKGVRLYNHSCHTLGRSGAVYLSVGNRGEVCPTCLGKTAETGCIIKPLL